MPHRLTRLFLLAAVLFAALPAEAQDAWQQARAPGTHLLMPSGAEIGIGRRQRP